MSKSRQKGTTFESAIVSYLVENGFPDAERWGMSTLAYGDIRNVPLVLEAKNQRAMTLAEWCDQAEVSGNRVGKLWAVVHKRLRRNIKDAYVTMSLENFVALMRAYAESNP